MWNCEDANEKNERAPVIFNGTFFASRFSSAFQVHLETAVDLYDLFKQECTNFLSMLFCKSLEIIKYFR